MSVLAVGATATLLVIELPAASAYGTNPPVAKAIRVVSKAGDESGSPLDPVASLLLDLAKEPAKNFVFDQLGLPTTASRLRDLSRQIEALSGQLTAVEARLSAQIAEFSLQGRIDYLKDQATNLNSLLRDYFIPLLGSVVNVKAAREKTPHDQAAIDAALADYDKHKAEFQSYANSIQLTTIAEKIHNRLQPTEGQGVLRQYGTLIMAKQRILTSKDSQRVIAMYKFFEEYQALATWMTVERAIAIGGSSLHTVKPTIDRFKAWKDDQRNPSKPNGLLPPIPYQVAIDRGPDTSAGNYTTKNRPMFAWGGYRAYSYAPWSDQAWKAPRPDVVGDAVGAANRSKLKGFSNWGVPSESQLYGLFSGVTTRDLRSIQNYIVTLFGSYPGPWIWTSTPTAQQYCYWAKGTTGKKKGQRVIRCVKKDSYRGLSVYNLSSEPHPRYNGMVDIDKLYREAKGSVIVVRDTGDQQYL